MPRSRMKSRAHPKYKTKYDVSNWTAYDRALVQRGDITLWISPDAIEDWKPAPSGRRGGQRKFSDHAIETALILRLVFKLPLRQTEGFLRSILSLMNVAVEAPDHTTLLRRNPRLDVGLDRVASSRPLHLIVDSTGLSIVGEGEWAAIKHGGSGKRGWKKLHVGVDRSGLIPNPTAGIDSLGLPAAPLWRRLLEHPQQDRFDHDGFERACERRASACSGPRPCGTASDGSSRIGRTCRATACSVAVPALEWDADRNSGTRSRSQVRRIELFTNLRVEEPSRSRFRAVARRDRRARDSDRRGRP